MKLTQEMNEKWSPILDHADLPKINDAYKRSVTAVCLENTEKQAIRDQSANGFLLGEAAPTNSIGLTGTTGGADGNTTQANIKFADPTLISMVRRTMPQLIAYDVLGVQPMNGPTGTVFAMRSRKTSQTGDELFYAEADAAFSGVAGNATGDAVTEPGLMIDGTTGAGSTAATDFSTGTGMTTAVGEAGPQNQVAFDIEKVSVTAQTRTLDGSFSPDLAQDMRTVHNMDAESELTNILSEEILAELNREIIRTIYINAKIGATQVGLTTAGNFDLDTDSNGRWMVEKFKGLMFQLERDANGIATDTRRGKGNIIITTSDVASALQMAGVLDYNSSLSNSIQVNDSSNTFAGVLNGRFKVYIDPFATSASSGFYVVGYKGASPLDAGIFYTPYIPLQMITAQDPNNYAKKIAFSTRYGLISNPFAEGSVNGKGRVASTLAEAGAHQNVYYRKVRLSNLM